MAAPYFIGVDVGTASARAGVFDAIGATLATASHSIALHVSAGDRAEQSSADIWNAVCASVREAVRIADIDPVDVAGIGFDATCSLVVLGKNGAPLPVGESGDADRNIIVWMDHRAIAQAEHINRSGHAVLQYVGGRISPEMQTPKLLWLSQHKPDVFADAWQFFDLPDFLTWKASGSLARSACTVTCKWTYLAHESRWDRDYFSTIGLGALADEGFARIGTEIVAPGSPLGNGLTSEAATDLGLVPGTAVAAALIDAHAGGVGTVGARGEPGTVTSRMAYVFGTSACTMATTAEPRPVPGVWGPYFSAMVPGLWLSEGGQSAAGAGIDHLVTLHPAASRLAEEAEKSGGSLVALLTSKAIALAADLSEIAEQAGDLHVVPEFLGNRAPHADPGAKALIAGLGMDKTEASLIALYVAGILGLGYGVRQIVDVSRDHGIAIDTIVISGGAGKSPLVRQLLADAIDLPVLATASPEPVLLGSAMLGAVAAGTYNELPQAMEAMSAVETIVHPSPRHAAMHAHRYSAFTALQNVGRLIRN